MITIGTFTRTDDGAYEGAIRTLTLNARSVRIRPIESKGGKAPDFRVHIGEIELGAACKRTSRSERDYISVRFDEPGFAEPVHALLVETASGFGLAWSRWA